MLRFTGQIPIDFKKERERLLKCFKGKVLERQMKLVDLFEAGEFEKWGDLYNSLPYNKENECSEREYVGMIFHDIISILFRQKFDVTHYEIVDTQ
jgi:hypothetical protein